MRLTLLGHAAFLIETAGQRVITDPYSSQIGYLPIHQGADIVTVSHHNPVYHSCLEELQGDFQVVQGLEILESGAKIGDITFGAVQVFEREPDEGPNAMVWLESDGIRVLHMGDCGVLPSDETLAKCGRVDILLALTGGAPTIDLEDLMTLVEKLQPRIVVPMHFGVPGLSMSALPVGAFGEIWGEAVIEHDGSTFEITAGELASELPARQELHVLVPARLKA
jgi:L-ascorbate metabolism protein UlaG (beta-lactamase superfamily)